MEIDRNGEPVREVVGIFHDPDRLQAAIDELLSSGFDRAELSLLAGEHAVEQRLGHRYRKVGELADDPVIPRSAYVSTEAVGWAEGGLIGGLLYVGATLAAGAVVVSGGPLAMAIAAAAVTGGTGALIGSVLARWVGYNHAHHLQDQLEHGGLLLWVRTWNAEEEERAALILRNQAGESCHGASTTRREVRRCTPRSAPAQRQASPPEAFLTCRAPSPTSFVWPLVCTDFDFTAASCSQASSPELALHPLGRARGLPGNIHPGPLRRTGFSGIEPCTPKSRAARGRQSRL